MSKTKQCIKMNVKTSRQIVQLLWCQWHLVLTVVTLQVLHPLTRFFFLETFSFESEFSSGVCMNNKSFLVLTIDKFDHDIALHVQQRITLSNQQSTLRHIDISNARLSFIYRTQFELWTIKSLIKYYWSTYGRLSLNLPSNPQKTLHFGFDQ